uniref:Uncharacterized protein n=1 Tax=Arundo donax TaxID=35708 RepID=A0A0A9CKW2_ARUDO
MLGTLTFWDGGSINLEHHTWLLFHCLNVKLRH